jgi:hypothetical protein
MPVKPPNPRLKNDVENAREACFFRHGLAALRYPFHYK